MKHDYTNKPNLFSDLDVAAGGQEHNVTEPSAYTSFWFDLSITALMFFCLGYSLLEAIKARLQFEAWSL